MPQLCRTPETRGRQRRAHRISRCVSRLRQYGRLAANCASPATNDPQLHALGCVFFTRQPDPLGAKFTAGVTADRPGGGAAFSKVRPDLQRGRVAAADLRLALICEWLTSTTHSRSPKSKDTRGARYEYLRQ